MDGSIDTSKLGIGKLAPLLVAGIRPGGNPRFRAVAETALRISPRVGVPTQYVVKYLLDQSRRAKFLAAVEKRVSNFQWQRPPEPTTPGARTKANLAALALIDKDLEIDQGRANKLYRFTGWGGLKLNPVKDRIPEAFKQHSLALLHEWYTPSGIADAIAEALQPLLPGLANRYGVITALEPSAGVGRFVDALNRRTRGFTLLWDAVELNRLSATILHKLHPSTQVYVGPYENFNSVHGNREYNLVVANPPFGTSGSSTRRFALNDPAREFMDKSDMGYFLKRGLHALGRCGLGVFLVPARFVTGGQWEPRLREYILRRAHILSCYRLPSQNGNKRTFPSMDTVVDIVFLRSRGGTLTKLAPDDQKIVDGKYYKQYPKHILGKETENSRGRYAVEGRFMGLPPIDPRPECTSCTITAKKAVKIVPIVTATDATKFASDVGKRVKNFLAGERSISWHEIRTNLDDLVEKHGNPHKWGELATLANSGDLGAQSVLRAFTKQGELVTSLQTEPQKVPPVTTDPLSLASFLEKGQGVVLEKLVALHQELGGEKAKATIKAELIKHGYIEHDGRFWPRWLFLSGDLWERYDEVPEGEAGDERRALLLSVIKPLVFEDIEFDPRQTWLPIQVLEAWLNEDVGIRAGEVVLERDLDEFVVATSSDEDAGRDLEEVIPWLNHERFEPIGKPSLSTDDIPDSIQQELNKAKRLGLKVSTGIRRALWEIFWLKSFRLWLSQSSAAQDLATEAYNRKFRGVVAPEFDDSPIEILRWTPDPKLQLRPHQIRAVKARAQTRGGILALAVGAGKTFTALAIIALGRQEGWIRRPVVVVPRSIVWQWYEEASRVLPDYRIGVVGAIRKTLTSGKRKGEEIDATADAAERAQVWTDFQAGYYDLVLLTDTSIATTKISDADLESYNDARTGIRRSMRMTRKKAQGKSEKQLTEKDEAYLENASAAFSEEMLSLTGREHDPGVEWSDLGIDFLVWDETGNIRNTWSPEPRFFGAAKFMGVSRGAGAQRAWQADYRAHSVRSRGGGILALSGTVGENSPAEPYNLLHFIDPSIMESRGIVDIEQFIDRYLVVEEQHVVSPGGTRELKSAVTGYKNLNELRHILFTHGTFVSHEQAGIRLPESQELLVEVSMDQRQRARYDEWRDYASQAAQNRKTGELYRALSKMRDITVHGLLGLGYDWDNALGGRAVRDIAPDLVEYWQGNGWELSQTVLKRQLDQETDEDRRSRLTKKLNVLKNREQGPTAKRKMEKHLPRPDDISSAKLDECARRIGLQRDCGHVVFVESTATHRWLVEILVAKGIDRNRIAVINGPSNPNVEEIARKFNGSDEEPRSLDVVVANSKGSRGVNLQREACVLHNLDLRWTPAEMEQRRGRIDRFGNTNPVIQILFYFARDSFDAFMFDVLRGKGQWRDSLFLREGDRSINPAAQIGFTDQELLMLLARTPEEGRKIQAEIEERNRQDELEKAALRAMKEFQRAAGRINDAAKAETPDEHDRLRTEARKILDNLAEIDPEAWPFTGAIKNLWEGDPTRTWVFASALAPPVTPGLMVEVKLLVTSDNEEGEPETKTETVVRQVGVAIGDEIGMRDNGSAKWSPTKLDTLSTYRYSDAQPHDDAVTRDRVAQHWDTWLWGDQKWVARMWRKHLKTIVQVLHTQPQRWVPIFRRSGLVPRASALVRPVDGPFILPPTPSSFETFRAWASASAHDDDALKALSVGWFGRVLNLSQALKAGPGKQRFRTYADAECTKRVLGIKSPTLDKQIRWEKQRLGEDTVGFLQVNLGHGIEKRVFRRSEEDLRDAVIRALYRQLVDRWRRLRLAQERHLAGAVDRVLPEFFNSLEFAVKETTTLLGRNNARILRECSQFAALDPAVQLPINPARVPGYLAGFLDGVTDLRVAEKISFVPLEEHQTLRVVGRSLSESEGDEQVVVSGRGNLFIHEIPWSLNQTLPADPGMVYRFELGNVKWAQVHPDSVTVLSDDYEEESQSVV